jgi:hypothetical protein
LDCAAALVVDLPSRGAILGIGRVSGPTAPIVGMRVIKSGAETGVTEGEVTDFSNGIVTIEAAEFAPEYELSGPGDSGSVWVDALSNSPVALHFAAAAHNVGRRALARPVLPILESLKLTIVIE